MKALSTVLKLLTALAAIAGAVYVIATYGDQIVAWAKKLLASCPCCKGDCEVEIEACEEACEEPCEEPCEEVVEDEAPAEEVVIDEAEPVAEEADFEG